MITVDGKNRQLARVVYEVFRNKSPGELCVCHTCDNPACINPEHLWLGTHADNNTDKVKKNRQLKGAQIANSKLTESQVREIEHLVRENRLTFKEIAKQFDVTITAIQKITSGANWKHVTDTSNRLKRSTGRKLDRADVAQIKMLLSEGISLGKIADLFEVSRRAVEAIKRGDSWKDSTESSVQTGKLQLEDVVQIKTMLKQGISRREIANLFGVSLRHIGAIALGDAWKNVSLD